MKNWVESNKNRNKIWINSKLYNHILKIVILIYQIKLTYIITKHIGVSNLLKNRN